MKILNNNGETVAVKTARRIICCSKFFDNNSSSTPISAIAIIKLNLADSRNPPAKICDSEILENKIMGDLRENDMNLIKIWKNNSSNEIKKFIKDTKCNCTYECALSYNILGNWKYQTSLIGSLFL